MKKRITTYIEYAYITQETKVHKVSHRDYAKIKPPPGCYGFRFFDVTSIKIDEEILKGDRRNQTGWFLYGEIKTKQQAKEEGANHILVAKFERFGVEKMVRTLDGIYVGYEEGKDLVIMK